MNNKFDYPSLSGWVKCPSIFSELNFPVNDRDLSVETYLGIHDNWVRYILREVRDVDWRIVNCVRYNLVDKHRINKNSILRGLMI